MRQSRASHERCFLVDGVGLLSQPHRCHLRGDEISLSERPIGSVEHTCFRQHKLIPPHEDLLDRGREPPPGPLSAAITASRLLALVP